MEFLRTSARTAFRTIPAARSHCLPRSCTIATLSQGRRVCTAFRPPTRFGALRVVTGHADPQQQHRNAAVADQLGKTNSLAPGQSQAPLIDKISECHLHRPMIRAFVWRSRPLPTHNSNKSHKYQSNLYRFLHIHTVPHLPPAFLQDHFLFITLVDHLHFFLCASFLAFAFCAAFLFLFFPLRSRKGWWLLGHRTTTS